MELFDVVNSIFSKTEWKKVSRYDKDRNFFMINRFISIGLPKQASMFNSKHIPKEHVLDYWNRQLSRLYSTIPSWIFTKGQKASKAENEKIKVDPQLKKLFCEYNKCSIQDFELLLSISQKDVETELEMYKNILKARKSSTISEEKKKLKEDGFNNELIGYYLDKNRLNKAIKHFSEGVKKTGDNVFYKSGIKEDKIKINSSLADSIEDQDEIIEEEESEEPPQYINGHIIIYSPVFDATKNKWKFEYNKNIETIDISKVDIANFILRRGKVVVGDCFKGKLEIVEKKTKRGYKNDYFVNFFRRFLLKITIF